MTDTFFAIPWRQMLLPELSWAEKLVRPLLVYLVLLLIFRLWVIRTTDTFCVSTNFLDVDLRFLKCMIGTTSS